MKKQNYELLACQYFVENQMSVAEISRRLNISEKTLHNWKQDGKWIEKRTRFLKSQYNTNQALYEFVRLLLQKALEDFKLEGILPDQKTLYFIMNMADKLPKLKEYEKQTAEEKAEELNRLSPEKEESGKTDDLVQKFFNAVIG